MLDKQTSIRLHILLPPKMRALPSGHNEITSHTWVKNSQKKTGAVIKKILYTILGGSRVLSKPSLPRFTHPQTTLIAPRYPRDLVVIFLFGNSSIIH